LYLAATQKEDMVLEVLYLRDSTAMQNTVIPKDGKDNPGRWRGAPAGSDRNQRPK
jgi:hypothetical protein